MLYYLGIDPGLSGAFAVISTDLKTARVYSHPQTVGSLFSQMLTVLEECPVAYACIERAQAAPGQGGSSIFKYGTNYGEWLGLLTALTIPHETVPPKKWQYRLYGSIKRKGDLKLLSISSAQQKFPSAKIGKNHNKADALNIAFYARETFNASGSSAL